MLDLLAAISSVDPPAVLAWLVLVFAAGMYPVGMMLGSNCSACCGCATCAEGELPDTVTVAISGYDDEYVQGPDLALLSFTSNYGSGAEGKVTAPSGDPATDKGPISVVEVSYSGSGYAVLGRVAPTLTLDGAYGLGTGATFTPTLNNTQDANGYDLWSLASVAVSGGTGYSDREALTITTAAGDTQVALADAIIFVDKSPPTLTLSGTATATIVLSGVSIYLDNPYYTVGSVTVTSGGSGYTNGQALTFSTAAGDVTLTNATATAVVISGDQLHSVTIANPGNYYHADPGGISVVVKDGGSYYREDASATPYLATVTIAVTQSAPSTGSGAVLAAIIDDDTGSASFGFITGVTITNGGDGYLAWANRVAVCCEDFWNGMSVVLKRGKNNAGVDDPCWYSHSMCGTSCGATVFVQYRGPSLPPIAGVDSSECANSAESSTLVTDCDELSFTATHASGATFTVTPGGEYLETDKAGDASQNCFSCCRGDSPAPAEVEVEVSWIGDPVGYNYANTLGTMVLSRYMPSGGCSSQWSIVLPQDIYGPIGSLGRNPRVVVNIGPCDVAATPQPGGNPYSVECDHCWKKCQTTAFVNFSSQGGGSTTKILYSESCASCADSPTCEPAAGTYVCDGLYDPSGYGWIFQSWTVTVS